MNKYWKVVDLGTNLVNPENWATKQEAIDHATNLATQYQYNQYGVLELVGWAQVPNPSEVYHNL